MSTPSQLSQFQLLADFCADHRIAKVRLLPYEEFVGGKCENGLAYIVTTQYTSVEQSAYVKITAATTVMRTFVWTGRCYAISHTATVRMPDETFDPITIGRYAHRPVSEYVAKREHARLSHRAGNARFPMDSYTRVLSPQYDTAHEMSQRHYR